jgi:TonB family protein
MGSALELQTDPQGADLRPYLTRILAIVRRNWFSVLPDSARIGVLRGRTVLQFVVNRDGSVPRLVIADSSGVQPLDRAAVAGLSMSNPLPPLPGDFKGGFIRLQFSFNYNEPSN